MINYRIDNRIYLLGLCLGKEPDVAEVDSKNWCTRCPRPFSPTQDRAITPQHHHHIATITGMLIGRDRINFGGAITFASYRCPLIEVVSRHRHFDTFGLQRICNQQCYLSGLRAARIDNQQHPGC